MSEKLIIPQVLTSPMPWGVKVEWKWPEGSHWFSKLEMQYLHSDGRLEKQVIGWPVTGKAIGGLKAGEHLQIRLRPIDKNGAVREWTQGDWIEGVSSSNAEEYLAALSITPGGVLCLTTSFVAPKFKIENGDVFINDAFISEAITAAENVTQKSVTKDDKFNAEKVLEDAWKRGCRTVEEGLDALALAASAAPQDYKQDTISGEDARTTYTASLGLSCNDIVAETLSTVLAATLPGTQTHRVEEAAIAAARAVRAAFDELDKDNASPR